MLVHDDNPEILRVAREQRMSISSSSKGNQFKWFSDNKYIKLNTYTWYENIAEVLVSYMLSFTNVQNYVKYHSCNIYEDSKLLGEGCYSYNYLNVDEQDITFYRLFKRFGYEIGNMHYEDVRDKLYKITGVDYKPYISTCLCIDAMTYNEDRHFNNFSVIVCKGKYSFAPVYDFGLACLADTITYPLTDNIDVCLDRVSANPFKSDFLYQLEEINAEPIKFRHDDFFNSVSLTTDTEKRALEVIEKGVERTRDIAWIEF